MSPRQNRVDPWGRLNAVPDRGAWMGNRGNLYRGVPTDVTRMSLKRFICFPIYVSKTVCIRKEE